MKSLPCVFLLLALVLCSVPAIATAHTCSTQPDDRTESTLSFGESHTIPPTLFQSLQQQGDDFVELNIATDLQQLLDNKTQGTYQKAYAQFGGQDIYEIKIRPRGHFRLSNCDFPPLKLNFSKADLQRQGFVPDFDKLKLVSPCGNSLQATKSVMREYLAYRLYNLLTDYSFRVVLVKINFKDFSGAWEPFSRYGFLIENKHEMAHRLGSRVEEVFALEHKLIASKPAQTMALFQYMIGNEDWSAKPMRNLVALKNASDDQHILVPYDFDFAGMTDAAYAIPPVDLQHRDVKQRHYFQAYHQPDQLTGLKHHYLQKEAAIKDAINQCPLLSNGERKQLQTYITAFYTSLRNDLATL